MLSNGLMASAVVTILYLIVAKIGSNLTEDEGGKPRHHLPLQLCDVSI